MTVDTSWDLGELRKHHSNLSDLHTKVSAIATQAENVGVGGENIYGLLHSHTLRPMLEAGTRSQRGAVKTLSTFLSKRAGAMQGAINDYSTNEQATIDKAAEITRDLGA